MLDFGRRMTRPTYAHGRHQTGAQSPRPGAYAAIGIKKTGVPNP